MFVEEKKLGEVPVRELEPWQEVCLAAARTLETLGWCQGTRKDRHGRMCAEAALFRDGLPGLPGRQIAEARAVAFDRIVRRLRDSIPRWNDTPGRTKEEVIALLRDVAGE